MEHVLTADEADPVGDAVAVSDAGPSDTSDLDAEDVSTTPAEAEGTLDPEETRSSAGASAFWEGANDEMALLASAAAAVAVAGVEPSEESVSAGKNPDVPGSSGGGDESTSELVGGGEARDDAVLTDSQEGREIGSDGIDLHRPASPPAAGDVKPEAVLMDADAAAGESLTEAHHEEERMPPQAPEGESLGSSDPASGYCEAVETDDTSPTLEIGEVLNADRVGAVTGGGGVEPAAEGSEGDFEKDGRACEEEMVGEGTEAVSVEREYGGTAARAERGGGKVGCVGEEESSTAAATEASYGSSVGSLGEKNERTEDRPREEEEALGAVAASATSGATMICNDVDAAGNTGEGTGVAERSEEVRQHETSQAQEIVREGCTSGVVVGEATASESPCASTAGKEANGVDEEKQDVSEEKPEPAAADVEEEKQEVSEEKQEPVAAETTASFSLEVVADAAPPPPVEQLESSMAGIDDGALLSPPAVDAHSSQVIDGTVSSVAEDNSGATAPDVAVHGEEEIPLDWEALAREVEAEWVMECSDGESDASLSPASPPASPPPPRAAEEVPPPYQVAVAAVETPSANSPAPQHEQEEVDVGDSSGDENEPRDSASNSVPEAPSPAAAAVTQSHRWEDGSSGGSDVSGRVAHALEDSKEEPDGDSDYWGDSDCGSVLPASSEGEDPIPTSEARASTHSTTGNSGLEQSASVTSPAGVQLLLSDAQTPPIGPMKDGASRSAARVVEPSSAPVRPPIHGSGVAEHVDGGRANQNVLSPVPVSAQTTGVGLSSGGGHDGFLGVSQRPEKETAPGEVGRGGGGCAASCGCVVM